MYVCVREYVCVCVCVCVCVIYRNKREANALEHGAHAYQNTIFKSQCPSTCTI
jgi:hypothetical protein